MADEQNALQADEGVSHVSRDPADVMAAIDTAFAPALRNAQRLGVVSFGDLQQVLAVVRQAFSHALNGAPAQHPPVDTLAEQDHPNAPLKPNLFQ